MFTAVSELLDGYRRSAGDYSRLVVNVGLMLTN